MNIFFLILHYYCIEDTIKCVESIKKIKSYNNNIKIIIVDNGSKNNSKELLTKKYSNNKNIEFIFNENNLGFAKGNNIGFEYIKRNYSPDFIIMTNNDVIFNDREILKKIINDYKKYQFAVLGPKIILKDGQIHKMRRILPQIREIRRTIFKKKILLLLTYLNLKTIIKILKKEDKEEITINNKTKNTILHGCCLIFSKEYINRFEGLNPKTFLYCEEELLFLRLKKNNLLSLYDNEISIIHNEDSSTNHLYPDKRKKEIFFLKNYIKSNKILLKELKKEKESYYEK